MSLSLDSSVLVAALVTAEAHHDACHALLDEQEIYIYSHALVETFGTLTGGRLGYRVSSSMAAELIEKTVLPWVKVIQLSPKELVGAFHDAQSRGIRGGAVYDYLHLAAAKKAGTEQFYTLNMSDFTAIHRPGDPEIASV